MATVTINLAGIKGTPGYGIHAANDSNTEKGDGSQVKNGSVFIGNKKGGISDLIEQKRAQARKQATKVLRDQFARDNKITDNMNEMRARNAEIMGELNGLAEQKKGFMEERDALQEKFGIDPDSQEQKDLELLRKANNYFESGNLAILTKDELERLANMGERTEYQQRALEYDAIIEHITSIETKLNGEKMGNTSSITAAKQAILEAGGKGIRAAKEAAESILDAASDSIIGMLWQDAKKHVDEEMEKLVEAAKEQAEKKEEQEEKLEESKEEKEEQEEMTEAIRETASEQEKLQGEIKKILAEAELLEEDMKGLVVNDVM